MKKFFAVIMLFAIVLCGCSGKTPSTSEIDYSKYNTQNFSNIVSGGLFCYDEKTDLLFYNEVDRGTGNTQINALVSWNGEKKRLLSDEPAESICVFDDKIYYTNHKEIISINTDGSDRKVLAEADASNLVPYWDGLLYVNNSTFKIQKLSPDGKITEIETSQKVKNFMLYEGDIYYSTYPNEMSKTFALLCFDLQNEYDYLLENLEVQAFDIYNGKMYVLTEENMLEIIDFVSGEGESTLYNVNKKFYPRQDGLYYFTSDTDDTDCLVKYDYESEATKVVCTTRFNPYLCGPYVCGIYGVEEYVMRWQQ